MTLRLLATTCHNGDCPKLYLDEETGDVVAQGYLTNAVETPAGEGAMRIPAADWRLLLAQLAPVTTANLPAEFDAVTHSAFRLETLQTYDISGEDEFLRAFREGRPRPERSVRTEPYLRRIAVQTAAGVDWSRVRVVEYPLSEYVRLELLSYVESQAAGERISVDRAVVHDFGPDFWLFDVETPQARAVLMHYDDHGRIVEREMVTDSDAVAQLAGRRAASEALAVPLNEFLAGRVDA